MVQPLRVYGFTGSQVDDIDTPKSKKNILIDYIKKDTLDKSINNIRKLGRIGEMFGNGNYSTVYPHQDYITEKYDSMSKVTLFTFNPKFRYSNEDDTKFLKPNKTNGKLKDYIVKFQIDDKNSIISKRTFITYANGNTQEFDNSAVPDYNSFINTDLVETKRLEKEKPKMKIGSSAFWKKFDPIVKERVHKLIEDKNCAGLQQEFNTTADNIDRIQNAGGSSSRNLKLLSSLEEKMKELNCY